MTLGHFLAHLGPQWSHLKDMEVGLDNPKIPVQLWIQVSDALIARTSPHPKPSGRKATGHKEGAEMPFYCWGWRARSIACPDCEEAYLRVSLTGLSCHSWGMVAALTTPEADGTEIQPCPWEPIWKETPE